MASHTRTLALLLATGSMDGEDNNTKASVEFPLLAGDECVLPEEHVDEAKSGYEVLKKLETPNLHSHTFLLAYYSYALGNPGECLFHLEQVRDICNIQEHIPVKGPRAASSTALTVPPTSSARASISSAGSSTYATMLGSSLAEIKDGRSWAMTEVLRSICLQGMSHEKLYPSDPRNALLVYRAALPLISVAASDFAFKLPASQTALSTRPAEPTPFLRFRELWRWVDRLMWRAIVIGARITNVLAEDNSNTESDEYLWTWLKHYSACSANWPADFRTAHRSTMSVIYLRALAIKHGRSFRPLMSITPVSSRARKVPAWLKEARSVISTYRNILNASTKFPHAGEHNIKVEDFVDLCAAIWEAAGTFGEHANWFIDIMWWAIRLTFHSPRVLRHMTRLLFLSGDASLGKRTLKLYAQIVGKAWQTHSARVGEETDTNENWVELLVFGVRMLCKAALATPGVEGMRDVRSAGELIEKAKTRLDSNNKRLLAHVNLTEGIWNTVIAFKEADPFTRPQRLAKAHTLFHSSLDTYPTALGYFYLALSFAQAGALQDVQQAILHAGQAVENDSSDVRYWHLLGILLTAAEQWEAAAEMLERGASLDEMDGSEPVGGVAGVDQNGEQNSHLGPPTWTKDDASSSVTSTAKPDDATATPTQQDKDETYVLERNAQQMPPSSDLLGSIIDQCWPLASEVFENTLQLRLTQVAMVEAVEGAEGAEEKWVEVFGWISAKKAIMNDLPPPPPPPSTTGRPSIDLSTRPPSTTDRPSADLSIGPPSTYATTLIQVPVDTEIHPDTEARIPITISPAPPENPGETEEKKSGLLGDGRQKRSTSIDRGDTSKSKKVQQMLKTGVHKGQERITTISKRIGNGVARGGGLSSLRRTNSTPDLHAVLHPTSYQASSIHSRRRVSSILHSHEGTPAESPTPPPPPPVPPVGQTKKDARVARENKMLSDVWLMSAATFRRLGKIEQAKGSIQEAEVCDESNPAVWVQLGLYYIALNRRQDAIDALQKALFISSEDVPATVHLARLYLTPDKSSSGRDGSQGEIKQEDVDLAAGLLSHLTRGPAWDVPEAWYFLAKAYGLQGRKDRERECLAFALELSEHRGVREISAAIGWCI
ncbi:hypothetical protein AX15_001868 [Amanita polypyramis BW_CC]|nr:hypothetical protein AX15_001868 [Amanita polypyramis BW_CC]